jgi:hypothetical protein
LLEPRRVPALFPDELRGKALLFFIDWLKDRFGLI